MKIWKTKRWTAYAVATTAMCFTSSLFIPVGWLAQTPPVPAPMAPSAVSPSSPASTHKPWTAKISPAATTSATQSSHQEPVKARANSPDVKPEKPLSSQKQPVFTQHFAQVRQGDTLRVWVKKSENTGDLRTQLTGSGVWFGGKRFSLFPQTNGDWLALLPMSVTQPLKPTTLKLQDVKGTTLYEGKVTVVDGGFRKQNIQVSSSMKSLEATPEELAAIEAVKVALTPERHWEDKLISPTVDCMNSPFGTLRYHNGKYTGNYHKGIDLRSPAGRPIKATASGTILAANMYRLHGGTVGIDHGQGVSSLYIHMSKVAAKVGQKVAQGDIIGYVGATGFATGPHLHWGLYVNGLPVNPVPWLKSSPGCS